MDVKTTSELSASLEDYLEAIFWTVAAKGAARTRDIAKQLKVKASSVTSALRSLAEKQYIRYTPYEAITLTETGFSEATRLARRHHVLRACFAELLGIDAATAELAAGRLEHGIPPVLVDRLAQFHEFIRTLPEEHRQYIMRFAESCQERTSAMDVGLGRSTVADLRTGQQGVITAIRHSGSVSRRLADMGLGRGALVVVEGVAPMGDPIRVKIRGYSVALRKQEAQSIEIVAR
jgi:DtxR family Mn-dependent transcriptional regulator